MSNQIQSFYADPIIWRFKLGEVVIVMSIPRDSDNARFVEHVGHVQGFALGAYTEQGPQVLVRVQIETGEEKTYNVAHLIIPNDKNWPY